MNCAVVLAGLMGTPATLPALRRFRLINAGLDLADVAVGVILISRSVPTLRGSGLAVVVQGLFLPILDTLRAVGLPPG